MSDEVNSEEIKKTQKVLSKYIKEPPLTDKLLRKPPFKFLHDIIKSVIKETGFLKDKFTSEDLNVENIKDKEGKIAFLKKLIAAVNELSENQISAKPNKIVAGLEVFKTLELLQAIGNCIGLKESGKTNIVKERSELKKSSREKKTNEKDTGGAKKVSSKEKRLSSKEKLKKEDAQEGGEKASRKGGKVGGKEVVSGFPSSDDKKKKNKNEQEKLKNKEEPNDTKQEIENPKENETDLVKDGNEKEKGLNKQSVENNQNLESSNITNNSKENPEQDIRVLNSESGENNFSKAQTLADTQRENSAKKEDESNIAPAIIEENRKKEEKIERKQSSRRQSSSRARPASKTREVEKDKTKKDPEKGKPSESSAKKVQKEETENVPVLGSDKAEPISAPKIERPATARKAPPSARAPAVPKAKDRGELKVPDQIDKNNGEIKPVEVITEDLMQEEDDKENLVVVETQPLSLENDLFQDTKLGGMENEEIGENEGALVAQILETKKELEGNKQLWLNTNQRNVEIEWEGGRKHKRDTWEKEVNMLRNNIQELTRTTNPLGKLFDFIQEDVDSMQRELKSWVAVTEQHKEQLLQEQRLTENTLEKYNKQLAELNSLIEQEQEGIRNIKAGIIANDRKIYNLVTRASVSNY